MKITLGTEEELMLIDRGSGAVVSDPKNAIFERANESAAPHRVVREFLRAQMETNSEAGTSDHVATFGAGTITRVRKIVPALRIQLLAARRHDDRDHHRLEGVAVADLDADDFDFYDSSMLGDTMDGG